MYKKIIALAGLAASLAFAVETDVKMHPQVEWKDAQGVAVEQSGAPVSLEQTCGSCHDADYIAGHSTHSGLDAKWKQKGSQTGDRVDCLACHTDEKGIAIVRQGDSLDQIMLRRPLTSNCVQCHGDSVEQQSTANPELNGLSYLSLRVKNSNLNISGKDTISRAMDVHAERGLQCSDCHFSLNHPAYYQEKESTRPDHLTFDGRKTSLKDYIHAPDHRLAMGKNFHGQEGAAARMDCDLCHSDVHKGQWEERSDVHFEKLSCQACHIPTVYTPVLQELDWTAPNAAMEGRRVYRNHPDSGVSEGYQPVLLKRKTNGDSHYPHGFAYYPYNLVNVRRWISGDSAQAVDLEIVRKATAAAEASGKVSAATIKAELVKLGVKDARVAAEVEAYPISHGVGNARWATRDCGACHNADNAFDRPLALGQGGEKPTLSKDAQIIWEGDVRDSAGTWKYQPPQHAEGLYLFGNDSWSWVDLFGMLMTAAVIGGALTHGAIRFIFARKRRKKNGKKERKLKKVYMYSVYERFWHWMQAMAIILLLVTGLEVHAPQKFAIFGFEAAVSIHNIMGVILALNAFLALFYHVAGGEIRQFLPEPRGFFNQAIEQQMFYLKGIFHAEPHPFEKVPEKKLNPLQQMAYLGLLNVLLPLQMFTGLIMWQSERLNGLINSLGGLDFIATIHTLAAWMFGAFIFMHMYLASTGDHPADFFKAMITGWEDVEEGHHSSDKKEKK
jgi:Ni/Fe-hydrogenase b-type cytochrome subunit